MSCKLIIKELGQVGDHQEVLGVTEKYIT